MISAGFDRDQVASILAYQEEGNLTPLRCPSMACPARKRFGRVGGQLLADADGLYCCSDRCGYRQEWVLSFMADWSWRLMCREARLRRQIRRDIRAAWLTARSDHLAA